jgi:hypothetical protein
MRLSTALRIASIITGYRFSRGVNSPLSLRLTRMPIITGLMVSPGWGSGGRRVSDFVTVAFSVLTK